MSRTRWRKRVIAPALAALAALGAGTACGDDEGITGAAAVARVEVTPAQTTVDVGATARLTAIVTGATGNLLGNLVTWTGDALASVDESGLVTGIAPGLATITATSGGRSGTAQVRVQKAIAVVDLDPATATVVAGQTVALTATPRALDGEALDREVTWSTNDASVATVSDNGIVTGVAPGNTTITATSGPKSAAAAISVVPPVNAILVTPATASILMTETVQLSATVLDAEGTELLRPVNWTSETPAVATVDATGLVTAVAPGVATITAASEGRTGTAAITVLAPVAAVVLSMPVDSLEVADVLQGTVQVLDSRGNALNRPVQWASSNPSVATVTGTGLVVGHAPGTTTITATSEGMTGQCDVVVLEPVTSVDVTAPSATVAVGQSLALSAQPRGAGGQPLSRVVHWSSSNPAIATVDQSGKVTGVTVGTATISASAGSKRGDFTVTVTPGAASIVVTASNTMVTPEAPTVQVTAVVRDAGGNVLPMPVTWTSSDLAILTVTPTGDQTADVTRVGAGDATITATAGGATGSVGISSKGPSTGEEEGLNNLSWPAIFADGFTIAGLAVGTDAGLRPTPEEGITADTLPFWYHLNNTDWMNTHYLQGGTNVWRAEWLDGSAAPSYGADVYWGDNLTHHAFNTHSMIHVEVALYARNVATMKGFNMFALAGSGPDEIQGTDGSVGVFQPLLFTVHPRLVIEKVDAQGGNHVFTIVDLKLADGFGQDGPGYYRAELNKAGKVVYGFNFMIKDAPVPEGQTKYGWYRLNFILEDQVTVGGAPVPLRVSLDGLVAGDDTEDPLYTPQLDANRKRSYLDIYIASASGGHGND